MRVEGQWSEVDGRRQEVRVLRVQWLQAWPDGASAPHLCKPLAEGAVGKVFVMMMIIKILAFMFLYELEISSLLKRKLKWGLNLKITWILFQSWTVRPLPGLPAKFDCKQENGNNLRQKPRPQEGQRCGRHAVPRQENVGQTLSNARAAVSPTTFMTSCQVVLFFSAYENIQCLFLWQNVFGLSVSWAVRQSIGCNLKRRRCPSPRHPPPAF